MRLSGFRSCNREGENQAIDRQWTPSVSQSHFHEILPIPSRRVLLRRERPNGTKEKTVFNAKRDGFGNGANLAIPSMGEVEGRLTVLEVVAMTALKRLVKAGDKHAAHKVLSDIRRAMRSKCEEIKLCHSDADSAISYAQELFDAAFEEIAREGDLVIVPAAAKRSGTRRSTPEFSS
jgi:hypothetical protein